MSNKNFGSSKKWKSMVVGIATALAAIFLLAGCGSGPKSSGGAANSSSNSSSSSSVASSSSGAIKNNISTDPSLATLVDSNGLSAKKITDQLVSNGFTLSIYGAANTYYIGSDKVYQGNVEIGASNTINFGNKTNSYSIEIVNSDYALNVWVKEAEASNYTINADMKINTWYITTGDHSGSGLETITKFDISQLPKAN